MSVRLDKITVDKLEGEGNWISWKFDINLQITLHGVEDHVTGVAQQPKDGEEPKSFKLYHEKESIARYLIGSTVGREPKQHILTCKSAKEMWDTLHAVYEQKNERRLDLLYCELFTYKKLPEDSIATHVSKLQRLYTQLNLELKNEGSTLPQSLLLNRILNTLPVNYLEFKNAWESVPASDRNVTTLMERLRLHEQRLNESKPESEVALVAKTEKRIYNKGPVCNYCKRKGHIKKHCFKFKNKQKSDSTNGHAFVAHSTVITKEDWIIDSGASHHITSHREYFASYEQFDNPIPVYLGDGSQMMAVGFGIIDIKMLVNGKWEKGHLKDAWFVPTCKQNLFSSGSALKNNLIEIGDKNKRIFKNGNNIKAVAIRNKGNMYRLEMRVILPENYCMLSSHTADLNIWHERLCHQNIRHVEKFLKLNNIPFQPAEKIVCDGCMFGKMSRLPFHTRNIRAQVPGQIIHADVCGPIAEVSVGGSRYCIAFKDDYSKYRKVYFIKEKTAVSEVTKNFILEAKTIGHTIKELITDGGKEFINKEMQAILSSFGINHRMTIPYSPQQNGAAERENRILMEAARSMLHANNFDKQLWAEAVNTAAYVLNRTGPTGVDDSSTPYSLWFGKKADISHLKIFGTKCFIHVPDQKRRKLDKKAIKGNLVGYCGDKDGYRIWTEDRKIVLSRDVKFLPEQVCVDIFKQDLTEQQSKHQKESSKNHDFVISLIPDADEVNSSKVQKVTRGHASSSMAPRAVTADPAQACDQVPSSGKDFIHNSCDSDPVFLDCDNLSESESESVINVDPLCSGNSNGNVESENSQRYPLRNRKIKEFPDYHVYMCMESDDECLHFDDFDNLPACWKDAINAELSSLDINNTWSIVDLPKGVTPIDSKWVFKIKKDSDNNIVKYKARLVARGYNQRFGIDYHDTYSPVVRSSALRILFSLAIQFDWFIDHWDVVTAFLHGTLNEDVFMYMPKGLLIDKGKNDNVPKVCKLNKAMYGLKQAASSWNKELHNALINIGFKQSVHEPCIYILKQDNLYLILAIYVDDIFAFGNNQKKKHDIFSLLDSKFKLKNLGPIEHALSLRIRRVGSELIVDQKRYIENILSVYGMQDCKPVNSPILPGLRMSKSDTVDPKIPYQNLIGSLMYIALNTRPDILHAVCVLSQYNNCYTKEHFVQVKRIVRYLKGTINYCLVYKKSKNFSLYGYVDADWANSEDRRSYSGLVFKLGDNLIAFESKKQTCVSLSSTEAEYVALAQGAKEAIFLKNIIKELYVEMIDKPIILYNDNQSCHKIAANKVNSNRTKHIDIKFHFIREAVESNKIEIKYLSTQCMVADMFTKPLSSVKISNFMKDISLYQKL